MKVSLVGENFLGSLADKPLYWTSSTEAAEGFLESDGMFDAAAQCGRRKGRR